MSHTSFAQLNISEEMLAAVSSMGFYEATPVQAQAIPIIKSGRDLIAKSQTGTGKTIAFGLPVIENLITDEDKTTVQALIVCPTRELALQVADEMRKLANHKEGAAITTVYGGVPIERQIVRLRHSNIVIGTPGRILDHIERRTLKLKNLRTLILDEADEMLSMGFKEEIEDILKSVPEERQTLLFSATMPPAIMAITDKYLRDPEEISIDSGKVTLDSIEQRYITMPEGEKNEYLLAFLSKYKPKRSIIFCNTKLMSDNMMIFLKEKGYECDVIHSDIRQSQRIATMYDFKSGKTPVLIATDIAARGIDVSDVDYVINYDIPQTTEYYVHRIGRTGRAGRFGMSVTLCAGKRQVIELKNIAHAVKSDITELKIKVEKQTAVKGDIMDNMRQALGSRIESKYKKAVDALMSEGYSPEDIAAAAMQLCFSGEMAKPEESKILSGSTDMKAKNHSKESEKLIISIGKKHKAQPHTILAAIAGATGISGEMIGKIDIFDDHTLVEVPKDLVFEMIDSLGSLRIGGKPVNCELYIGNKGKTSKPNKPNKPNKPAKKPSYNKKKR